MGKYQVAKRAYLLYCVIIVTADRSAPCVAACHNKAVCHYHIIGIVKKKHLHRCIRKHNSDSNIIGGNTLTQRLLLSFFKKHYRLLPTCEVLLLTVFDNALTLNGMHIPHHYSKGLHGAVL